MGIRTTHLGAGLAVLLLLASQAAMGQGLTSSQMQELMEGARPLANGIPPSPPADPAYLLPDSVPEAPALGEPVGLTPRPLGGAGGGQWNEYRPPDYEDGLSSVGPCCESCGRGANCPVVWYVDQRATVWARSRPRGVRTSGLGAFVTVEEETVFRTVGVMGTRSAVFDVAAGYGATVGRYWRPAPGNRDMYLEASYFGLNAWRESRDVNATQRLSSGNATFGNLFTPYTEDANGMFSGIGGFDRADHHEIQCESGLNNVEVNVRIVPRGRPDRIVLHPNGRWRRECQPGIYGSYLFGIRYFSLDEQFSFRATGHTDFFNDQGELTDSLPSEGAYDVDTYNEMLGLQIGLDIKYRRCRVEWGGEFKAAPCVNFAGQRSRIRADDPATGTAFDVILRDREDDAALLGEVSVVGCYHLRPNLTLRGSWDMMWAVGVALAPEQVIFVPNPPARLNNNGVAFYQGISLGLVWTR